MSAPLASGASRVEKYLRPLAWVGQAQHALGDDIEVHFRRAALDGIGLGAQPPADGRKLVALEALTLPAQALLAQRLDDEFGAVLGDLGAGVLHDRGRGAGSLVGPGLERRATDGELEGLVLHLMVDKP